MKHEIGMTLSRRSTRDKKSIPYLSEAASTWGYTPAFMNLGDCYKHERNYIEAAEAYHRAAEHGNIEQALLRLSQLYPSNDNKKAALYSYLMIKAFDNKEAKEILKQCYVNRKPGDDDILFYAAISRIPIERLDEEFNNFAKKKPERFVELCTHLEAEKFLEPIEKNLASRINRANADQASNKFDALSGEENTLLGLKDKMSIKWEKDILPLLDSEVAKRVKPMLDEKHRVEKLKSQDKRQNEEKDKELPTLEKGKQVPVPPPSTATVEAESRKQLRTQILTTDLKDYVKKRKAENEPPTHFGLFSTPLHYLNQVARGDGKVKIAAAESVIKMLEKPNINVHLTVDEIKALKDSELGGIISMARKAGILPAGLDDKLYPKNLSQLKPP